MNITTRNWRDLIRPRGIHLESDTLTDFYGKFTCEPLERGFGITLGNSLRRILLSSLQGAAITAIRIDGALHEFTTVGDVVEDVVGGPQVTIMLAQSGTTIAVGSGVLPGDITAIAAAVLAAAQTTPIHADAKKMKGANVIGTGTTADAWRGVGVAP